ncbi:hypothetical protein D3C77_607100 [compost metagenome]
MTSRVYIPPYILDALAFACGGHLSEQVLYKMCVYRLKNPMPFLEDEDKPIEYFKSNRKDRSSCVGEFLRVCPDDDVSYLIKLLRW